MSNRDYSLTPEQIKAAKKVERAMKEAAKLNVGFWDDYGSLYAFNAKTIDKPVPDDGLDEELDYDKVYQVKVPNFGAGNADDTLYVQFK